MKDVIKAIDMVEKWKIRDEKFENYITWAIIVHIPIVGMVIANIVASDYTHLIVWCVIFAINIVMDIVQCVCLSKSKKRAREATDELKHNYARLKLVSKGCFDILSFFTSPDKITFLQGPKFDGGITVVILIMKNGTIETCEMDSKEVATMFEQMPQ